MPVKSPRPISDSPNPGAGLRAVAELLRDPKRSDRLIAAEARCEHKLRTMTDLGTLSAQYVRMAILDRRGIDPLA